MLRPGSDSALIELAAGHLLAATSGEALSKAAFTATLNRLLAVRGGLVEVGGGLHVRLETFRAVLKDVTAVVRERVRAELENSDAPEFSEAELVEKFARIDAAVEAMLAGSLH
jgi:hypothetical protein